MDFGTAVKTCFRKYAEFNGRASLAEFWWFILFEFLVGMLFMIVFFAVLIPMGLFASEGSEAGTGALLVVIILLSVVGGIGSIALAIPMYAAQARRLHDMGQSGWWVLLNFVSLGLIPLIMAAFPSQMYPNEWGPQPVE